MTDNVKLTLLVTGSIAARKTPLLVKALQKEGHDVTVMLTRAPEEYEWVSISELEEIAGHKVLTDSADWSEKKKTLFSSRTILVAPASADFISQMAYESTNLGQLILEAHRCGCQPGYGAQVMIAPAMNYKMWEHPATQRNCAALLDAHLRLLGPDKGLMACGDEGYGRMVGVDALAKAVTDALKRASNPVISLYEAARPKENARAPFRPPEGSPRVVVALAGRSAPWLFLKRLVADINQTGLAVDYVMDSDWMDSRLALEALTKKEVIWKPFQVPGMDGMEHIKLPERATCVFFPFLDKTLAEKMLQGRTNSFCLSLYLASKAPVVTTTDALKGLSPFQARGLTHNDGVLTTDSVGKLVFISAETTKKPPVSTPR